MTTQAQIVETTENTVTLDEMSEWTPPVATSRASARPALSNNDLAIDMAAVEEAIATGEVPKQVLAKLDRHIADDEKLNRLWHGDKSRWEDLTRGRPPSGSLWRYSFAEKGMLPPPSTGSFWVFGSTAQEH